MSRPLLSHSLRESFATQPSGESGGGSTSVLPELQFSLEQGRFGLCIRKGGIPPGLVESQALTNVDAVGKGLGQEGRFCVRAFQQQPQFPPTQESASDAGGPPARNSATCGARGTEISRPAACGKGAVVASEHTRVPGRKSDPLLSSWSGCGWPRLWTDPKPCWLSCREAFTFLSGSS